MNGSRSRDVELIRNSDEDLNGEVGRPARGKWWRHRTKLLAASGVLFIACIAAAVMPRVLQRSKRGRRSQHGDVDDRDGELRIPLKEVVRFKERQWFVEELEASREGDPNAMLRLAKMYLHGQGCDKNHAMVHEWLRKAKYMGVYCSMEELYAGDDWKEEKAAAAAAARRAQKHDMAAHGALVAPSVRQRIAQGPVRAVAVQ